MGAQWSGTIVCRTPTTPTDTMRRSSGLKVMGRRASEIFGELLQLAHGGLGVGLRPFKTVLDVIVDQFALGVADRVLDRVELLGDLDAGLGGVNHRDDGAQMALRALEPAGDLRMRGVLHAGPPLRVPPFSKSANHAKLNTPSSMTFRPACSAINRHCALVGNNIENKFATANIAQPGVHTAIRKRPPGLKTRLISTSAACLSAPK